MKAPVRKSAPSPGELAALRHALRAVSPLSDEDLDALTAHSQRIQLDKGGSLLQAGQRACTTAFVLSGGLREYYVLEDGNERTKGFNLPGEFGGSLSDLLSDRPSRVWITAEAPTALVCTPWEIYDRLSHDRPAWSAFARRFAETLYLIKVEREFELLALDAARRYARAKQRWPMLEAVFSQKDIASYVGVTPVHLSRLRAGAHAGGEASAPGPSAEASASQGTPSRKG